MEYRRLGASGVRVSEIGLGSWLTYGVGVEADRARACVARAYDLGVNFFDTADVYGRGAAEEVMGEALAPYRRGSYVLATKVFFPVGDGPNDRGLSRKHVMESCHASLRRLRTDYVDLYQCHRFDDETPLEETLRALDDLVRQGKVRYLGASNYVAFRLTRALWDSDRHGYARYECLQPKYNLVFRDEYERELEPLCLEQNLGVIPYSSLGSGFLSGKYRRGETLPATARAAGVQKTYMTERGFAVLAAVEKIAAGLGVTPTQVAISWLAHRPGITAPIASATSKAQLQELAAGVELQLDAEARKTLDEASAWREA